MRTRTTAAAIVTACLLTALTTACGRSSEEVAADCQQALAKTPTATKTNRPDACTDLSEDDYTALLISQGLRDSGVIDEDGNVDPGKLLPDDE
ncbi:hypothetical protein [Streptomyces sp. NPDC088270]|uniref:hypothetical protein n=1 Tax=unclassified Streptomyces TaxID=2593676 RepID=UPI00343E5185